MSDSALGSFDPAAFVGNPSPPAKVPDAPKNVPAPAAPATSAGTGALPPSSAGGGVPSPSSGPDSDAPQYSVVQSADGQLSGFADTKDGSVRLLTVNGPEASRVFHTDDAAKVLGQVAHYDEASKTWSGVPENTIKALAQGRPALPEYWKQQYNISELEAVKSASEQLYEDGKITLDEYRNQTHLPTLQHQLAERPDFAWFGKAGILADAIHNPLQGAQEAVTYAGGKAISFAEGLKPSLEIAAASMGAGAAAGLVGGPPAALWTGRAVAGVGFYQMSRRQIALQMADQGYDPATIKATSRALGLVGGALGAGAIEAMNPLDKGKFFDWFLKSEVAQKALANWAIRSGVIGGTIMGVQQTINGIAENLVAYFKNRPELLEDPTTFMTKVRDAMIGGAIGGALIGGGMNLISEGFKSFTPEEQKSSAGQKVLASGQRGESEGVEDVVKRRLNPVETSTQDLTDKTPLQLHPSSDLSVEKSPSGSPEQNPKASSQPGQESQTSTPGEASTESSSSQAKSLVPKSSENPQQPGQPPQSSAPASQGPSESVKASESTAQTGTEVGKPGEVSTANSSSSVANTITPESVKVKAEEEARPVLEKYGIKPEDTEGAKKLFQDHNDAIHQAKAEMGIGKDFAKMTPQEKAALIEKVDNMPAADKARLEKAFFESGPVVAALQRKVYIDQDPETAAAWARAENKAAGNAEPPVKEPPLPGGGEGGEPQEPRKYFMSPDDIHENVTKESTPKNLRDEYLGYYRTQVARGNQLARRFDREITDPLERAAIVHYADAGGDLSLMAEAAHDPKIPAAARDIYAKALNLSPEAIKWADNFKQFYKEAADVGTESGVLKSTRENYFNRVYEPKEGTIASGVESSGNLRPGTSHARGRTFETLYDAYQAGMKPATTDPADLVRTYNNTLAKAVGSRALYDSMEEAGLGAQKVKQPQGWEAVEGSDKHVPLWDKDGNAVLDAEGNQVVSHSKFYMPAELAKALKPISEPDLLRRIPGVAKALEYQGVAKTFNLGWSLFHDVSEAAQSLAAGPAGWSNFISPSEMTRRLETPEFEQQELSAIREGKLTSPIEHDNADFLKKIFSNNDSTFSKLRDIPVVKQALELNDRHVENLFGKTVRFVKVNLFTQQKLAWIGDHPDVDFSSPEYKQAMLEIGKHVNDVYGGQNWASRGYTKTGLALMRLTLLAPDWVVSNLNQVRDAIGGGGEATRLSRYHLAVGAGISTLALEGLNMLTTGHLTNKNPKGHELEVEMAPNVYFSPFRGAPHDMLTLYSMLRESGAAGAARFASGKGGPLSRLVLTLGSGTQYNGLPVSPKNYKKDSFENKLPKPVAGTYDEIAAAFKAGGPAPFSAVNTYDYWNQEGHLTLLGLLMVASGIGRYSKPPKEKGGKTGGSPVNQMLNQ